MFKKAILGAGIVAAAALMAVPAQAAPDSLRANLGGNDSATLSGRWNTGVQSHVSLGGLKPGTYKYSLVMIGKNKDGSATAKVIDVCTQTLKPGETKMTCGGDKLILMLPAGVSFSKYTAQVTQSVPGAAPKLTASGDFH